VTLRIAPQADLLLIEVVNRFDVADRLELRPHQDAFRHGAGVLVADASELMAPGNPLLTMVVPSIGSNAIATEVRFRVACVGCA
jgi:hypothetical protein